MIKLLPAELLANARLPIVVTEFGMTKSPEKLQPLKAEFPILVTEFGILSSPVKPIQPLKALSSIEVKPVKNSNSSNEVIHSFPLNTSPRFVTAAASP